MKKKLILILLILIVLGVALFIGKNDIYKYLYPKKYSDYVEFYSKEYNLDENLVYSIIKAESKFKVDIFKPQDNIRIGCWYLNRLYREFGDLDLVIAAYNGGSGNVKKWLADEEFSSDGENLETIPFKETASYDADYFVFTGRKEYIKTRWFTVHKFNYDKTDYNQSNIK